MSRPMSAPTLAAPSRVLGVPAAATLDARGDRRLQSPRTPHSSHVQFGPHLVACNQQSARRELLDNVTSVMQHVKSGLAFRPERTDSTEGTSGPLELRIKFSSENQFPGSSLRNRTMELISHGEFRAAIAPLCMAIPSQRAPIQRLIELLRSVVGVAFCNVRGSNQRPTHR